MNKDLWGERVSGSGRVLHSCPVCGQEINMVRVKVGDLQGGLKGPQRYSRTVDGARMCEWEGTEDEPK